MAIGDLYELVNVQTFRGQTINNVYHYHQGVEFVTTDPTQAQALAEEWVAQKLPYVLDLQISDLVHESVQVRNLFNPSDQFEQLIALAGNRPTASNEYLPIFTALRCDLAVADPAVRAGSKFYAGLDEVNFGDNIIATPAMVAYVDALEGELATPVQIGLIPTNTYYPVVVKRVREGVPGSYTYRMPDNAAEAVFSEIVVALFDSLITSQVRRKVGVGI